jgi:PKHD-type hydroxylase
MQYIMTPYAKSFEAYAWWEGAFTSQELDWLQEKAKNATESAGVGNNEVPTVNTNIRRSNISWLSNTPDTLWVYERLANVAAILNSESFKFDLTGFGESLQLTHYDENDNGMYGWHQDYGSKVSRKLSMTVQLTDASEYEGGNLQIMTTGIPSNVRKQRGLIAVFPSYILHQVEPVTKGSRQSLVAWISGVPFR